MSTDLRHIDIRKLNSITKYPSIETYHIMGERGQLLEAVAPIAAPQGDVIATEKIDGVNARIVVLPGLQYLIGSREEFLYAGGDLLANPAMGIVEAVSGAIRGLLEVLGAAAACVYGEVYGGKTTAAAREYTGQGDLGFRIFDIARFDQAQLATLLDRNLAGIAEWRDGGGQDFLPQHAVVDIANLARLRTVPVRWKGPAAALGKSVDETHAFLGEYRESQAEMDDQAGGHAEGLVVRTANRSWIYKIRHEDYDRTIRRRARR